MTLTKEEFKQQVTELFATGKTFTDDMFDRLAELIAQFADSVDAPPAQTGGAVTVELEGQALTAKGTKWENLGVRAEQTENGTKLIFDGGPWFGTYNREYNGKFPAVLALVNSAGTTQGSTVDAYISGNVNTMAGYNTVRFGNNGLRDFSAVTWTKKGLYNLDSSPVSSEELNSLPHPTTFITGVAQQKGQMLHVAGQGYTQSGKVGYFEIAYNFRTLGAAVYNKDKHVETGNILDITGGFVTYYTADGVKTYLIS